MRSRGFDGGASTQTGLVALVGTAALLVAAATLHDGTASTATAPSADSRDIVKSPNSELRLAPAALRCLAPGGCDAMCEGSRGLCHGMRCSCVSKEEEATAALDEASKLRFALSDKINKGIDIKSKAWFVLQVTVGAMGISITMIFLFWLYGQSVRECQGGNKKCKID